MGSLFFAMLAVIAIGIICIRITLRSTVETAASEQAASWECATCGAGNPSSLHHCSQCGMEPQPDMVS